MKYAVNPVNNVKFFPFYATENGFYDETKRYSDQLCAVYSDRISGINPGNGPYCGGNSGFFTVTKEHETDGLSESVSYEFKVLLKRVADENAQLAQSDPRVQKELQMLRMIKIYTVDMEVNTNPGFSASIEACLQELYSGKYHLYYEGFFEETIDKEKQLQAIREATASNAMGSMLFFSEAGGAFDYGLPLTVILEEDSSQTELTEIETPYSKVDEFRISIDSEDHPTSSYIWSCESELEELKIPEVFYIDIPLTSVHSMSQNGYVKRIELPPSVSELESRAFESMSALESVVIAGEVQEISESCFNYCSVLNNVQLNSATERIMPYAFSGCNALTRINLEHVKTISEKSFSECHGLKDLELTDLETMDKRAFCSCMGLVSVNMPKLQEIPEFAFEDCSALTEVKLSPQIRRVEHCAFLGCTQLKEIYIGESIEYIDEGAFEEGITFVSDTPIEVIRKLLGGVREFSYRLSDGTKVLSEWEQRQADALAEEEAEEAQIAALKQEEKAENIAAMKSLAGQVKSVLQDKTRHKILFDETDRSASFQDVFRQLADSYTGRDKAMISAYFLDNDSLLENDFEVCLVLLKEMADITANPKEVTQPKEEPTAPASPLAGMGAMGDAIARARAAAAARMQEVAAQGGLCRAPHNPPYAEINVMRSQSRKCA